MKRLLTIILLASAICSCRTIQVVPEIHKEYIHDTINRVDSIYRSHYITMKGDTIWQRDTIYEYRWRDKVVEVYRTDSIPYEVEVPVETRYIPGFYKWSTWVCWIIIVGVLIYVVCRIAKAFYLRR
mgnify:CR=1 FL=1